MTPSRPRADHQPAEIGTMPDHVGGTRGAAQVPPAPRPGRAPGFPSPIADQLRGVLAAIERGDLDATATQHAYLAGAVMALDTLARTATDTDRAA